MQDNVAAASLYGPLGLGETDASGNGISSAVQCLTSADQLADHARQIEDLASCALAPNIVFELPFLRASWVHFFAGAPSARVVLIWDNAGKAGRKLIGLLPLVCDTRTWSGVPLGTCFRNNMKFSGMPLIDRDSAGEALDHLLAAIQKLVPFPSACLFDELPAEGEFAQAFSDALARSGWFARSFDKSPRVMLDATCSGDEYLTQSLSSKKRKEYRRLSNRLKDMGELRFDIVRGADDISGALDDLLRLESEGWKGANHSAILDREDWCGFFRESITAAAHAGQAEIVRLMLNGRAIAAGLVLTTGDTAWFYKIAYQEDLSHYSPGVLLTLELTKHLCDRPDIRFVDSCARDDHPMITHLWRERCDYHDLLIVPPGSPAGVIFCAETMRRGGRKLLKKSYHFVKRKLRG